MSYSETEDKQTIKRTRDGAFIPPDPLNPDRKEYEAWLAAGNTPWAHDADPAPLVAASLPKPAKKPRLKAKHKSPRW